jgi:SAM-dependent methyltransferase
MVPDRSRIADDYRAKYDLGVLDRSNSLSKYDDFLANMGEHLTLAALVAQKIERRRSGPVRVLDIGCGTGGALSELKERFTERVETLGVDLLPCQDTRVDQCIAGDAWTVPFPPDCGVVFSFRALHEIGHSADLVSKVCASLSDNGTALLSFRVATVEDGKRTFLGEMSTADESFLVSLGFSFGNCRFTKTVFFDAVHRDIVTGVFLRIEK